MRRIHIGLGSNLGDRVANLRAALERLDALDSTEVHAVSHVYESESWPDPGHPSYANAAAVLETGFTAPDLLEACKQIEADLGREPAGPNAPRPIDIDILLSGDEEWDLPDLVVPHPRMLERAFVVVPLLDVDPHVRMPDGSPLTAEDASQGRVLGMLGPVPGFEERTWGEPAHVPPSVTPRSAAPDEEWVPVWQRPGYNPVFSEPEPLLGGHAAVSGRQIPGAAPSVEATFAQLVLEQLGIPFVWDPFAPEMSTDPYGLARPFALLVPESMAEEARVAIEEASNADIQWEDLPE